MTQANVLPSDREAAASAYFAWISGNTTIPIKMRSGELDHHSMVQAFARHRDASVRELVEALQGMLAMHGSDIEEAAAREKARAALASAGAQP